MVDLGQLLSNPAVVFFLVCLAGWICSKVGMFLLNTVIRKLTEKTKTTLDDEILEAVSGPVQWAITVAGIFVALKITEGFSKYSKTIDFWIFVASVLFSAWILSKLLAAVLSWYVTRMEEKDGVKGKGFLSKQILPFMTTVLSGIIFIAAITIVLSNMGVEIAPLIGSLGIAGLAVALALQDTLSNFFSGIYFLFDKPIRAGDFVSIDGGFEGYVEEIGWRNTKIALLNKGMVIIPNAKLAQSTFTNRNLKEDSYAGSVKVMVGYETDMEKVERLLKEAADKVIKAHPDAVNDKPASVTIGDFGDFSIAMNVFYVSKTYARRGSLENALKHEILKSFRENGVEIPLPKRIVINK